MNWDIDIDTDLIAALLADDEEIKKKEGGKVICKCCGKKCKKK